MKQLLTFRPAIGFFILPILVVIISLNTQATTISFQEGASTPIIGGTYDGVEDTYISDIIVGGQNDANQSNGGNSVLRVGRNVNFGFFGPERPLFRFNTEALSGAYSTIDSMTLRLNINSTFFSKPDSISLSLYSLTPSNAGWVAGNLTGVFNGPSQNGNATWNAQIQGQKAWAGSAGASTPSIDYNPVALTTTLITSTTPINSYIDFTFNGMIAQSLVELWNSGLNSGMMLMSSDDTFHSNSKIITFNSSEASDLISRPQLLVSYEAVPEAGSKMNLVLAAGFLMLIGMKSIKSHLSITDKKS